MYNKPGCLTVTLTFPRTLQSQGHCGHVNLLRKVTTSQTGPYMNGQMENKSEEKREEILGFSLFLSGNGGCYGLTRDCGPAGWSHETAAKAAPRTRCRSAACCLPGTHPTHLLLYCTYLLFSHLWPASSYPPLQLAGLAAAGTHQPHRTRPDRSLLITLASLPPSLLHSPAINNIFLPQFGQHCLTISQYLGSQSGSP